MNYIGLLYMDFLIHKNRFLSLLALFTVLAVLFELAGVQAVGFLVLAYFAPKIVELITAYNVMEEFELFLLTTPVSRKDVVRSRYLMMFAALLVSILGGVVLCFAAGWELSLVVLALGFSFIYGSFSLPECLLLKSTIPKKNVPALAVFGVFQTAFLVCIIAFFGILKTVTLPYALAVFAGCLIICAVSYLVSQWIYAKKEF